MPENSRELLAEEWTKNPPKSPEEVDKFYKEAKNYVGDLLDWNASAYKNEISDHVAYSADHFKVRTILDIGAGIMSDSIKLSEKGFAVTSVDFDSEHYRYGQKLAKEKGLDINIKHVGDELEIYDAITLFDVIEHVHDPGKFIDFYAKKAKSLIFMTVPENIPPDEGIKHPMHLIQYADFWKSIPKYLEEKHGFKRLDAVTFKKIKPRVLCSISTKNRYETYLPMALMSIVNQTELPDHLIIYDDNDNPKNLMEIQAYQHIFQLMSKKGLSWEVEYGQRRGVCFNHQRANTAGFDWVWRLDDDCFAEPRVLERLKAHIEPSVGAIGGSILTPSTGSYDGPKSSSIDGLHLPNKQWFDVLETESVDHLNCSFLYRAGIVDYNLNLSPKSFREETMFTYGLKLKGYEILIIPDCVTYDFHAKGGIR